MTTPRRIQRRRGRATPMPPSVVYVGRGTQWDNPFRITRSCDFHGLPGSWFVLDEVSATYFPEQDTERSARQKAVDLYAAWLATSADPQLVAHSLRAQLAGRDLACWCPTDQPCHADVLLQIANPASTSLGFATAATTSSLATCPLCAAPTSSTAGSGQAPTGPLAHGTVLRRQVCFSPSDDRDRGEPLSGQR